MNTPDTTTEQDEALLEVLTEWAQVWPDPEDAARNALEGLQPVLAAIRRQAAADALTEQARHLDGRARFWRDLQTAHEAKGRPESADPYRHYADQAHRTADHLRKEAAGIIAEGYEFECASGSAGCCEPVPDAGDMCPDCEANEYDDRWAE
jgi:hypothetical protein